MGRGAAAGAATRADGLDVDAPFEPRAAPDAPEATPDEPEPNEALPIEPPVAVPVEPVSTGAVERSDEAPVAPVSVEGGGAGTEPVSPLTSGRPSSSSPFASPGTASESAKTSPTAMAVKFAGTPGAGEAGARRISTPSALSGCWLLVKGSEGSTERNASPGWPRARVSAAVAWWAPSSMTSPASAPIRYATSP